MPTLPLLLAAALGAQGAPARVENDFAAALAAARARQVPIFVDAWAPW
ncbi:MAG TPA: hypothetical protein VFR85_19640 [Anaeromyxobacteraceae bacterium]|nr:hypothetical protein [Anaeromyxobacteraceae bacterium]